MAMREARELAGVRQNWLAEQAGMSPSLLYAYESGRNTPGLFNAIQLAECLGLRLEQYVGLAPLPDDWGSDG